MTVRAMATPTNEDGMKEVTEEQFFAEVKRCAARDPMPGRDGNWRGSNGRGEVFGRSETDGCGGWRYYLAVAA